MESGQYKKYHEMHMMFKTGTSAEECWMLVTSLPLSVFFSLWMSAYVSKAVGLVLEFCLIILPAILNVTVLSDWIYVIVLNLLLLCTTVCIVNIDQNIFRQLLSSRILGRKNFITDYRASINFVTAICILAVDFTIFPGRFAKTESFGFGLMDLGVGFFVCSHGLVERHGEQLTTKRHFIKLLKTICALFTLGVMRLLSVKILNYHEHVTEYGVHWNFFFTLVSCRFFAFFLKVLLSNASPLWLSVITGLIHQILLFVGLEEWVLSDIPRDSFMSANREGMTSCLGFISIYFAGSSMGKFVTFSSNLTYKKLLVKLIIVCVVTWVGTLICFKVFGISRRLANLGYILWVITLSLSMLIFFIIGELSILAMYKRNAHFMVPRLLESINANGLFFFLFSNFLTGLINIFFQTLLLGKMIGMMIIVSYMIILCSTAYFLYIKNIFLKF